MISAQTTDMVNKALSMYPFSGHPLDLHRMFDFVISAVDNDDALVDLIEYVEYQCINKFADSFEDDIYRYTCSIDEYYNFYYYITHEC